MKLEDFLVIKDEIEEEISNINELFSYYNKISGNNMDKETQKRVYASIIADFYLAVERILKLIAREIDDNLLQGSDWHKKLLRQMSVEMPGLRREVIDKELFHELERYLKFRHLVRNIYGFQLNPERFENLLADFRGVKENFIEQLYEFMNEMEEIILAAEER